MNKENTKNLLSSFPKMYCNLHVNYPPERKVPFEFQCHDGWFNLIWEMSQRIELEINRMEKEGCLKTPSVTQVKEKFGLLRVYMTSYPESVDRAIKEAVERSKVTCEVCGKLGMLCDERKWQFTRCDEHKDD